MPKDEKPLPEPPRRAVGAGEGLDERTKNPFLMADRMAMAMAQGNLEEFLDKELPENENARKLAMMMLGMSGMAPVQGPDAGDQRSPVEAEGQGAPEEGSPAPEEVMRAAAGGDVQGLMALLKAEYEKRHAGSGPSEHPAAAPAEPGSEAIGEKEILDRLVRIASENSLSVDWLVTRALKVYVLEYLKTGKL